MSTQDSTTNSTSGTSQAAEQNASFQQDCSRMMMMMSIQLNIIRGLNICSNNNSKPMTNA